MVYNGYEHQVPNGYSHVGAMQYRPGGVWHNPGRDEAIAALVLSFFFPILGFILGILSLNRSRRIGWPGERMAKAALWISVLSVVAGVISYFLIHRTGGYTIPIISNLWWV